MAHSQEKATQTAILEWLAWKRIFHYRQNSGGFKRDDGHFYRFGAKGAPDIIAVSRLPDVLYQR
jgi:hypothetical protein